MDGEQRVNYYSDDYKSAYGYRLGDSDDDNTRLLTERRFIMAEHGDESRSCKDGSPGAGPKMTTTTTGGGAIGLVLIV